MGTIIYRGYRVDPDCGVVFGHRGRPIRKICTGGYIQAQSSTHTPISVHRLVWEAVHGPIPIGMQINHINGIKKDNRIINLELVTGSENVTHAYRIGLMRADGEHNGRHIGKVRSSIARAAGEKQ